MQQHDNHEILQRIAHELQDIFDASPDGVYVWVDETHKDCNKRLAEMFGHSVEEWRAAPSFLETFIAEDYRDVFSWNYHHHVRSLRYPVTFRFRGLRKDGSTFAAETDMIPLTVDGHPVAYHFVRELKE